MRNAAIALALLAVAGGAQATSDAEECKAYQEAAESVMYARQYGRSPEELYEKASDTGIETTPTFRKMVSGAYEIPQSVYANGMKIAAEDYGEKWFARCMEGKGS